MDRRKLKERTEAKILRKKADGKEEPVALVKLTPREGQRVLEGRVPELPAGQYRIVLDIPDLKDEVGPPPVDPPGRRWRSLYGTSPGRSSPCSMCSPGTAST